MVGVHVRLGGMRRLKVAIVHAAVFGFRIKDMKNYFMCRVVEPLYMNTIKVLTAYSTQVGRMNRNSYLYFRVLYTSRGTLMTQGRKKRPGDITSNKYGWFLTH